MAYNLNSNDKLDLILQSNAAILYHMGISYAEGQMTGQVDHQKAVDCYRQAAMLGNSDAMFCLAICYSNGYGVELDHSIACEWYMQAGNLGHSQALYNLGLCYQNGWGVPVEYETADAYFQRAARLGNAEASPNLS